MNESALSPVAEVWAKRARITAADYEAAWAEVRRDPEGYWKRRSARPTACK